MDILSDEGIKAASNDDLVKYNQALMAEKEAISEEQQKVKGELNKRYALKGFKSLPKAEQDAITQYINAGGLAVD
jgi:hypothetical protein